MKHAQPRPRQFKWHKSGEIIYDVSFTFRIMESYGGDIREVSIKQTKKSFLVVPEALAIASLAILK